MAKVSEWDKGRGMAVTVGQSGNSLDDEYRRLIEELRLRSEDPRLNDKERLAARKDYLSVRESLEKRMAAEAKMAEQTLQRQTKTSEASKGDNLKYFDDLVFRNHAVQNPETGKGELPFDIEKRKIDYRKMAATDPEGASILIQKELQAEKAVNDRFNQIAPEIIKKYEAETGQPVTQEKLNEINSLPLAGKKQVVDLYLKEKAEQAAAQQGKPAVSLEEETRRRQWLNENWKDPNVERVRQFVTQGQKETPGRTDFTNVPVQTRQGGGAMDAVATFAENWIPGVKQLERMVLPNAPVGKPGDKPFIGESPPNAPVPNPVQVAANMPSSEAEYWGRGTETQPRGTGEFQPPEWFKALDARMKGPPSFGNPLSGVRESLMSLPEKVQTGRDEMRAVTGGQSAMPSVASTETTPATPQGPSIGHLVNQGQGNPNPFMGLASKVWSTLAEPSEQKRAELVQKGEQWRAQQGALGISPPKEDERSIFRSSLE